MPDFDVFETREFLKKLDKLSENHARAIRKKLHDYVYPLLKKEPFFGMNIRKLRDYKPDMWRYRMGGFRLFYTIDTDENMIYILSVDFRRNAYR